MSVVRRGPRIGFDNIPREFWTLRFHDDHGVNESCRTMLGWLRSHDDDFLAGLSMRKMADMLDWSRRRVETAIERLVEMGWMHQEVIVDPTCGRRTVTIIDDAHYTEWFNAAIAGRSTSRGGGSATQPPPGVVTQPPRGSATQPHRRSISRTSIENTLSLDVPSRACVDDQFAEFWKRYPLKVDKPAGQRAFKKALTRAPFDAIMRGLDVHVQSWSGVARHYIPHPATWLNGDRWNDEPIVRPGQQAKPEVPAYDPSLDYMADLT